MKLFLCLFILTLYHNVRAQKISKWRLSLGAEYSITGIRNIRSPFAMYPYAGKANTSLYYGLYGEYEVISRVSLLTGILRNERDGHVNYYHQQTINDTQEDYYSFYRKVTNRYWTAPLLVRYYFPVGKGRLYAEAGGYAAVLSNGTAQGNESETITTGNLGQPGASYNNKFLVNDKSHTNKFDTGLVGGAGLTLPLTSRIDVQLNLRLWYGLRQVDGMYNNEVRYVLIGGDVLQQEKLDYYNLNSHAKYIAGTASAGLVVRL